MAPQLIILPILIPAFAAALLALLRGCLRLEKVLAALTALGLTGVSVWMLMAIDGSDTGVVGTVLGGWEAPYGIAMVADRLACIMLCLSSGVGAVALIYTFWTVTETQQRHFFYPLFFVVILGCNWAFLSGDLFNLFVSYEVMLIGSYGMMMVGASKPQVRQTMKYIGLNAVGSTIFVAAVGLIYATTGTLNMADLAVRTATLEGDQAAMVTACSTVLLTVFAMKTAAWPLYFWLPDSYPVVPAGANGFYAGLLTKVGVYSLLRVFVMVFRQPGSEFALEVLLVLSGFTMLFGVLGAMCQWEIRRILSWHIISQVGYMVMGIGLVSIANDEVKTLAIAGTIFYIVHHIVVKSCLFLVGGIAGKVAGTQELKKMGGVLDMAPGVAGLFIIASFSLAGLPPFSGFLAKFVLLKAGLAGGTTLAYIIVAVAIVTSFFTLYSMTKIWGYAFWRNRCKESVSRNYRGMMVPTAVLVVVTVVMGVWAQPFSQLASRAATTVIEPTAYIESVPGMARERDEADDRQAERATSIASKPNNTEAVR